MTHDTPAAERLIFVYNADAGVFALLADVAKKALGIESCTLCAITHGTFSKRAAWARCERSLEIPVTLLHRDELPTDWQVDPQALPCVLVQRGGERPELWIDKHEVAACAGRVEAFSALLQRALGARGGGGSKGKSKAHKAKSDKGAEAN